MMHNIDLTTIPYVRLIKIDSSFLNSISNGIEHPGGGFFICKNGELTLETLDVSYTLHRGDFFMFPAETSLVIKNWSEDIIGVSGIADIDFIIPVLSKILDADILMYLLKHRCTSLTEDQMERIEQLAILLYDRERQPASQVQRRLCQCLGLALYYEIIIALWSNIRKTPSVATRKDRIFLHFLSDIREDVAVHKDVRYYAQKQNLSPKYFSLIIKECTGLHAREWIALSLVNTAKAKIMGSQSSIKEIAYALGFPNQSAFGRFFRSHTGVSPQKFRADKNS
ncbi:MAG: helix-turn-helix domain-containing protein [Candidatus Cryptobacteroides sp.]